MGIRWKLFLDDIREPPSDYTWTVARSFDQAKSLILHLGMPNEVSFDHDLGEQSPGVLAPTGYDFAKWMIEYEDKSSDKFPEGFKYQVHSANPVGRENIVALMDRYLQFKSQQKSVA